MTSIGHGTLVHLAAVGSYIPSSNQSSEPSTNWGEFAGSWSAKTSRTTFDALGHPDTYSWSSTKGLFLYDGSYHTTQAANLIYGIADDCRVLIGQPFAFWSDGVSVSLRNLMPSNFLTSTRMTRVQIALGQYINIPVIVQDQPTRVRVADHGRVYLQGSQNPAAIYLLEPDQDSDGDGMPDDWETYYQLNPNDASDRTGDADNDSVPNYLEFIYREIPATPIPDLRPGIDTDGDGMPNVWEWKNGLNYENPADAREDPDKDGLTNLQEFHLGTNPQWFDSDGDSLSDGEEANLLFTNPLSAIDADGDNLADDWEKFWARQILASGVDLTPEQRAALVAGDIDPNGDMLQTGVSHEMQFKVARNTHPNGSKYLFQIKERACWGHLTTGEGGNHGGIEDLVSANIRWIGSPSGEPYLPPDSWTIPEPSTIEAKLLARSPWTDVPWNPEPFSFANAHTEFQAQPEGTGIRTQFRDDHQVARLILPTIEPAVRKVKFLKVTSTWGYPTFDPENDPTSAYELVEVTVPANKTVSDEIELKPALQSGKSVDMKLLPVEVVPDDNMAGVIGDEVKPLLLSSPIKHFVTPKQTDELNQPHVILKAVGVTADQITPGNPAQIVEWEGGEVVPNEPLKRRVKRDASGMTKVKINTMAGGVTAAQMDVWVVWATVTTTNGATVFAPFAKGVKFNVPTTEDKLKRFKFKIEPAQIYDQNLVERPRLSAVADKRPPGYGNIHSIDPILGPCDTADLKWDVARQIQISLRNPNNIPKAAMLNDGVPAAFLVNLPTGDDVPVKFPQSDIEGNDDAINPTGPPDENCNPYQVATGQGLDHAIGELSSVDGPSLLAYDNWGAAGRSLQIEYDFREFARLELWDGKRTTGQFWCRISEQKAWHHHLHVEFDTATSKWKDSGSSPAPN